MKQLYFECTSGISGDMTVAALLDLGASEQALREGLASLGVEGYEIEIRRVKKSGIDACDFTVRLDAEREHGGHYHSEDAHGHHGHGHCGHGNENHEHCGRGRGHGHGHCGHGNENHEHHGHGHEHTHTHRNLGDILALIDASEITGAAKKMAGDIFRVVARAEAKVHGLPVEEVHFHEVGAVDSIVDIVGAAICIDNLGVGRVLCSPLREGTGTIRCQHGVMPVPAPATLEILSERGIPLMITDNVGEMVTPTGAAIVAALAESFEPPKEMRVAAAGYGAGKREYKTANLLRALLIETEAPDSDSVLLLECNIDDMTGEQLGYACGRLLEAGALDVWCAPVTMKKSRPGQVLSVLCEPAREAEMTALLMRHTSTIGVRVCTRRRHVMERSTREVQTAFGPVTVKDCVWGDIKKTSVEYESARLIADSCKIAIDEVYRAAYNK